MSSGISGGLLQCAYHIQLLAMSANFASPAVTYDYRKFALYFRWWAAIIFLVRVGSNKMRVSKSRI